MVVTLLSVIFGLLNLVLVIPLLEVLFDQTTVPNPALLVTERPPFEFSIAWAKSLFNYYFYDNIINHGRLAALKFVCLLIVVSIFLANLFRALSNLYMASMRIRLLRKLRQHIFEHVSRLPLAFFTEQRKGDLLTRMSSDAVEVEYSVVSSLRAYFKEPLQIIAYFVMLFAISPSLTLLTLLTVPLSGGIIARVIRSLRKPARSGQNLVGALLNRTEEMLSGLRIVKAFTAEKALQRSFEQENQKLARVQWSMSKRMELAAPLSEFLNVAVVSAILYFGGRMILNGESQLEASEFIGFLAIFSQISRPAKVLSNALNGIQKGLAAADRIFELLDEKPEVSAEMNTPQPLIMNTGISFQNVSFRYQEDLPWVLKEINLTLPKGKTIALVGASGSGKSTLADLIPQFYTPTEGQITWDGTPLQEISLERLRSTIAMVTQESILFNDTLYNNIRFGNPQATREQIEAAAKMAQAHDFILESEDGYDTTIGDQGSKLSGGQRQRLAIARAVLKDPQVLILDEATSALDTKSERLVQEAFQALLKGRTALVIAHRLSTIQSADQILVMEEGKIVESGTHAELQEQGGLYKKLLEMQWYKDE